MVCLISKECAREGSSKAPSHGVAGTKKAGVLRRARRGWHGEHDIDDKCGSGQQARLRCCSNSRPGVPPILPPTAVRGSSSSSSNDTAFRPVSRSMYHVEAGKKKAGAPTSSQPTTTRRSVVVQDGSVPGAAGSAPPFHLHEKE